MRYVPHTDKETKEMLAVCGVKNSEELFRSIPKDLRTKGLDLPEGISEQEVVSCLEKLADDNKIFSDNFLGAGAYRHYVPTAVTSLTSRAEFLTPYTPYQPELAQGTLQVMFEYQSYICRLTGMDVSNASHYDGTTAASDAGLIARKINKRKELLIPENLHPHYKDVIQTVCEGVVEIPCPNGKLSKVELEKVINDKTSAVFLPFPNFWGIVEDHKEIAELVHSNGALAIAVLTEPLALAMFKTPGEWGADIVVGEGMSFGMPVSFGGPTLGLFACKEKLIRYMPGRICGETVDKNGKRSFVLTLATREQHIRREKATSNICSNQALCATTAVIYLSMLGSHGLSNLARMNFDKTEYARKKLLAVKGVSIAFEGNTFNEFAVKLSKPAKDVLNFAKTKNILAGVPADKFYPDMKNVLLVSCTELNSKGSIDRLASVIAEAIEG